MWGTGNGFTIPLAIEAFWTVLTGASLIIEPCLAQDNGGAENALGHFF